MKNQGIVLASRDQDVCDAVLSSAAAVDADVAVIGSAAADPGRPELLLLGADMAAEVARAPWWEGAACVLIGFDAAELARWSMSIDARVILLPDGTRWLGALLAGESPGANGSVTAFVGGSGGLGTSTLAAGVAAAAVRRGVSAALVDADPRGGGIDLLCGGERLPGWRWPELTNTRGQAADLAGFVPRIDGVDVISMGRLGTVPGPEAMGAVVASLRRTHQLVVVDAGRGERLPSEADAVVVCCGRRVGAVAAARETARGLALAGVVVRDGSGGVPPDQVAGALGARLLGVIPEDAELSRGAEAGVAPGLAGRRRWQRACEQVAREIVGEAA